MHSHSSHDHHHGHHHHDHSDKSSTQIAWAFFLNFTFTIIEFIGGYLTNSTAIMADAVHDLGDTLSIGSAWVLNKLGNKKANESYSYGFKRFSLLGALLNGVILIIGSTWVLIESVTRLFDPQMPMAEGMFFLALLGICVNGYAAYRLSGGKSLNEKMLNWHLIEDVLGWVAVLIVSVVLMFVEWPLLDPILSIAFTLFILFNVVKYLRSTFTLFFQATPDQKLLNDIQIELTRDELIVDSHHLHLWSLDGEQHVLTVHLELLKSINADELVKLKQDIASNLAPFNLAHTTIEFEFPNEPCRDELKDDHQSHVHESSGTHSH
jgi:cobalt-zinc-cadmium efflux system protein